MANVFVQDTTMTEIADSIRNKLGSAESFRPDQMPEAIMRITDGKAEVSERKPICFYDYDGTFLHDYTFDEMKEMDSLPVVASHEGLVSQGWNWSLEDLKQVDYKVNVGAMYVTDDGATRIYVKLDDTQLDPTVILRQTKAHGVAVDWGDGSEFDYHTKYGPYERCEFKHTYQLPGEYVIRLIPEEGTSMTLEGYRNYGTYILCVGDSKDANARYSTAITKIELGNNINALDTAAFSNCMNLEAITVPGYLSMAGNYTFVNCSKLRFLVLPPATIRIDSYCFSFCYNLHGISMSKQLTTINIYAFAACYSLVDLTLHDGLLTINSNAFDQCRVLGNLYLTRTLTRLNGSLFSMATGWSQIVIPDNIIRIEGYALDNINYVRTIKIGKNLEYINGNNFTAGKALKEIYLYPETPPQLISSASFKPMPADAVIYVPKGCLSKYTTAQNWSQFAQNMQEMEE